jgi:hypothetical protein
MEARTLIGWGFILLSVFTVMALGGILRRAAIETGRLAFFSRLSLAFAGWIALISAASASGFLSNWEVFPPRAGLLILGILSWLIFLARSKNVGIIIHAASIYELTLFQSFRILVELLIWALFVYELFPITLSFEGRNWDVLSGLSAIPIAMFYLREKKVRSDQISILRWWNILASLLLINVVVHALLSLPTPLQQFSVQPDNRIVGEFPFVFLPGVLVLLAAAGHVLSFRKLAQLSKA